MGFRTTLSIVAVASVAMTIRAQVCSTRQEEPMENQFALKFCHIYPSKSCCLPVHDAEIEGHYFNLLDAGEICAKHSSKAKDFLKSIFCFACAPTQPKFIGSPYQASHFTASQVLRVCKSVAEEIHPREFSSCGMTLVAERGSLCAGDDTIVPKFFWPECKEEQYLCRSASSKEWSCSDTKCAEGDVGTGLANVKCSSGSNTCSSQYSFLNDERAAKPPYFEDYAVEIVDEEACRKELGQDDARCDCYQVSSSDSVSVTLSTALLPFLSLIYYYISN